MKFISFFIKKNNLYITMIMILLTLSIIICWQTALINDSYFYQYFTILFKNDIFYGYLGVSIAYIITCYILASSFIGLPIIFIVGMIKLMQIHYSFLYFIQLSQTNLVPLCIVILLCVVEYMLSLYTLFKSIKIGKSTMDVCFIQKKIYNFQIILNYSLNYFLISFLLLSLSLIIRNSLFIH